MRGLSCRCRVAVGERIQALDAQVDRSGLILLIFRHAFPSQARIF